jgi:predicted phosphoribosyltransferase
MTESERLERIERLIEEFYVHIRKIYCALFHEACDRMEFLLEKEKFDLIEKGYRDFKALGEEEFPAIAKEFDFRKEKSERKETT